jgi:two-component system sensor histidine kinase VanS
MRDFGLGLALVASIAAAHGGAVDATATPTGGLDITIRLPRRDLRPPADDRRAGPG